MLDAGISPNVEGEGGATPLHQAAWRGQLDVVQLLLGRGADRDIKDRLYGQTALEWALDGAVNAEGNRDACVSVVETLGGRAPSNDSVVTSTGAERAHNASPDAGDNTRVVTNDVLIARMIENKALKTPRLLEAFRKMDRGDFVPAASKADAYADRPLPLAVGATISQPTVVAIMLELLQPGQGDTILDIGSGSGWTTALLSACVGSGGSVTGTEIIPDLVAVGRENLARFGITNAAILPADDQLGLPGKLFNRILVSAAAREIPDGLVRQLTIGGTMVIPVGTSLHKVTRVSAENIQTEAREGFVFVPLR